MTLIGSWMVHLKSRPKTDFVEPLSAWSTSCRIKLPYPIPKWHRDTEQALGTLIRHTAGGLV